MRISFCEGVAVVQIALALGALALGYPSVALAFGAFALVQVTSVVAQRCSPKGACETNFVPGMTRDPSR